MISAERLEWGVAVLHTRYLLAEAKWQVALNMQVHNQCIKYTNGLFGNIVL